MNLQGLTRFPDIIHNMSLHKKNPTRSRYLPSFNQYYHLATPKHTAAPQGEMYFLSSSMSIYRENLFFFLKKETIIIIIIIIIILSLYIGRKISTE